MKNNNNNIFATDSMERCEKKSGLMTTGKFWR